MKVSIKRTAIFLALLLVVAVSLKNFAAATQQTNNQTDPPVTAEQLARAKATFKNKCSRCHGESGKGDTVLGEMLSPPDFTDVEWWTNKVTDERLATSITNGKIEMPAFGKKLTKHEIAALVVYVRCLSKSPRPAASPGERKTACD